MIVRRVLVHVALVTVPVAVVGHASLLRPRALAVVAALVAFAEVEHAVRRAPDPSRFGAPGTHLALVSGLGLLVTAWAALAFPATASALAWLGLLPVAAGIALRALAIRALGPSFTSETVVAPGRHLVTGGVYAHLRHPSDVGLLLVAAGLALLGGSVVAAAAASLIVLPSTLLRMSRETALLRCHSDALAPRG